MPVYYLYNKQVAQAVITGHHRYKVMSGKRNLKTGLGKSAVYQIRIKGHLSDQWTGWFEDLTITLAENGDTLLTGPVPDQAALFGLLRSVRDLGMQLISVNCVDIGNQDRSTGKP